MERTPLLVLGLGNLLCADDGAGVLAVNRLLDAFEVPNDVRVLDGGTLGLGLLPWLQDADQLLLVDAVAANAPPGTLVRLEGPEVSQAAQHRLSVHQIGVADLLDGARLLGDMPGRVVLVGIVPAMTTLGLDRTPAVDARLPDLVAAVAAEIRAFGYDLRPREHHAQAFPAHDDHAARVFGL